MTRNRVLVVKLSSLGDVIHVTPCLKAIRRAFPKAEIVMAVDSRFTPVVRYNPYVDKVIESPPTPYGSFRFLFGMFKELASLQDRPFDVAMDFQGNRRSAAWVYASRGRFKAGRGKRRPGWDLAFVPDLERHAVVVCAEIARKIGISVDELKPEIFLSDHDDGELLSILETHDLPKNEFILVNPFSRWHSKNWPLDRYAELISKLWDDLGLPIIITGGPGEEDQAAELICLMKPGTATPLAGKLTLGQAFCLTRRALLMITCDSGPMHAAAALGTKVVALFGPTLPERTGPWGDGHQVIQIARPSIHHTYLTDTDQTYMRAIDVQTVYHAVIASLGSLRGHSLGTRNSQGDTTKPGSRNNDESGDIFT
jgi:ADP-heptose:LPS heptosyltransferase